MDMIRSGLDQLRSENIATIINAKPYSAASKPIESKFAVLDRFIFSQMDGWAGGDRLRKKTASLGQLTVPYPASFEDFAREADERLTVFETIRIGSGPFANKSPRELFSEHITGGWRPLLVSSNRVNAAFCTRQTRRVSRGYLKICGNEYRHPDLVNGQRLTIAIPWRRASTPLALLPDVGWQRLQQARAFGPCDRAGARESSRLSCEFDVRVQRLEAEAGHIDLVANHRERFAALLGSPTIVPMLDTEFLPEQVGLAAALSRPSKPSAQVGNAQSRKRLRETEELEQQIAERRA